MICQAHITLERPSAVAHLKTHLVTLTEYEAQYGPPEAIIQDVVQRSDHHSPPESSSPNKADTVTVSESHSTVTSDNLKSGPINCLTDANPMESPSSGIKSNRY